MNRTKIVVAATKKYTVTIGPRLIQDAGEELLKLKKPCKVCIVTDRTVDKFYSDPLSKSLKEAGFEVLKFVFPSGEQSKNISIYSDIVNAFAGFSLTRVDLALALGGGVVGDLTGFAAATYLRGIDFVQFPTTLLAAVDSSVGGKTGIDLDSGKNLVGAFHQPIGVFCDTDTLKTLPKEELSAGMAEVLKSGIIRDESLFTLAAEGATLELLPELIARSVRIKRDVVETDEFETGDRMLLNLGHTFGHAIERLSHYEILHGNAVAIGMVIAAKIAEKIDFAKEPCSERIIKALQKNHLPTDCIYDAAKLALTALSDKKRRGDKITLVLPRTIGIAERYPIQIVDLPELIALGLDEGGRS